MGDEWWFDASKLDEDKAKGIIPASEKLNQYLEEDDFVSLNFLTNATLAGEIPKDGPFPQYPYDTIFEHFYKTLEAFPDNNPSDTWYDLSLLYSAIIGQYVSTKDDLTDTQKIGLTVAVSGYFASSAIVNYTYHGNDDKSRLALGSTYNLLIGKDTDLSDATNDELYALTLVRLVYDKRSNSDLLDIESFLNGNTFELNVMRDLNFVPYVHSRNEQLTN